MHLEWRKSEESGPPLGVIFGVVLAAAAGAGAVWFALGLPTPVCQLREWTGMPCPTCGSTRLARALLRGDVVEALRLNPLVLLGVAGVALWAVVSAGTRLLRLPVATARLEPREWLLVRIALVAIFVGGWAYVILRAA